MSRPEPVDAGGAAPRGGRRGRGLPAAVAAAILALGGALGALVLDGSRDAGAPALRASLTVAEALGTADAEGFARAVRPRPFAFPRDHGPHPAFRTEWWYWTGTLEGPRDGRRARFGFQLTFFRTALVPDAPARPSAWATRDVYLAHFALADIDGGRFHAAERWARGTLGLGGARGEPFGVWLGAWSARGEGPDGVPMRLRAAEGDVAIDLRLASAKPPVLHGERGLSRKSEAPGNASYYYSLTRMPAAGEVRVGGRAVSVRGQAWMDREWSTSALGPDQVGWDWFALQLDDGRELMVYRLRGRDGRVDPASQGTLVAADGTARPLVAADVLVEVGDRWTSPRTGTRYPARWRLRVPAAELDLRVAPLLADQELDLLVRYWEGAVRVEGTAGGRPVAGAGYVELVGYGGQAVPAEAVRQ